MGVEIKEGQQACGNSSSGGSGLPLVSLNHVSFVCRSVAESARFYEGVLGFQLIKRPSSFNFEGAWLFAYGIGIHLLEAGSGGRQGQDQELGSRREKRKINPKDNHISFQCSDMGLVMRRLKALGIDYVTATVEEGGVIVDQLFFHDPDGYMVEICNCNNLPVLPLDSLAAMPSNCTTCPLQNNQNDAPRFARTQGAVTVAVPNAAAATVR